MVQITRYKYLLKFLFTSEHDSCSIILVPHWLIKKIPKFGTSLFRYHIQGVLDIKPCSISIVSPFAPVLSFAPRLYLSPSMQELLVELPTMSVMFHDHASLCWMSVLFCNLDVSISWRALLCDQLSSHGHTCVFTLRGGKWNSQLGPGMYSVLRLQPGTSCFMKASCDFLPHFLFVEEQNTCSKIVSRSRVTARNYLFACLWETDFHQ